MRNALITGMGAVSPGGLGVDALWRLAASGRSAGEAIIDWDVSGNRSRIGSRVPVAVRNALRTADARDPVISYAETAAREAWSMSGLSRDEIDPGRAGLCIGTAVGGVTTMESAYSGCARKATDGDGRSRALIDASAIPRDTYRNFRASAACEAVACALGLEGLYLSPSTGCTAGLDAIGMAADAIRLGRADIMVCGASEAPFTPIVVTAFDNIHCLTSRNDEPCSASRPFDRDRDGFLLGEGAGILILEEEEHARRRGAPVFGSFLGYASGSSAYHMTALAADGMHQAAVIRRALANARLASDRISYFNLHGTSTPQNDLSETCAIKSVLGPSAYRLPMSSTKSAIGHALGAASALAAVVCLMAKREGVCPPTANLESPGEGCDLDYVAEGARPWPVETFGINASGFSGIHTTAFFSGV